MLSRSVSVATLSFSRQVRRCATTPNSVAVSVPATPQTNTAQNEPPKSEPKVTPEPPKKSGGSFYSKLAAFFAGVGMSSVIGLYKLQIDMYAAAGAVEDSIHDLGAEVTTVTTALEKRITALENKK